jgi:hypothetical protein
MTNKQEETERELQKVSSQLEPQRDGADKLDIEGLNHLVQLALFVHQTTANQLHTTGQDLTVALSLLNTWNCDTTDNHALEMQLQAAFVNWRSLVKGLVVPWLLWRRKLIPVAIFTPSTIHTLNLRKI